MDWSEINVQNWTVLLPPSLDGNNGYCLCCFFGHGMPYFQRKTKEFHWFSLCLPTHAQTHPHTCCNTKWQYTNEGVHATYDAPLWWSGDNICRRRRILTMLDSKKWHSDEVLIRRLIVLYCSFVSSEREASNTKYDVMITYTVLKLYNTVLKLKYKPAYT